MWKLRDHRDMEKQEDFKLAMSRERDPGHRQYMDNCLHLAEDCYYLGFTNLPSGRMSDTQVLAFSIFYTLP